MPDELIRYEWECPICSQQKMSLTSQNRATLEGQAKNNLLSHIRVTDGGGHGKAGDLPPGFALDNALDWIHFNDGTGDEQPRDDATLLPR